MRLKTIIGILAVALLTLYSTAPPVLAAEGQVIIQNLRKVAELPVCNADRLGQIYMISDGSDATDCATGAGSTLVFCSCDGSAPWVQLGSLLGISDSASLSSYVLITKAGQQSITATGSGNDITLTTSASGDDLIFAAGDALAVTTGGAAAITTTAGAITLTAGGTTQDVTLVSVDDVLVNPADDFVVTPTAGSAILNAVGAGEDVSLVAADDVVLTPTDALTVSAASATINAGGSTIEFSVGAGNFVLAGTVEQVTANVTVADDAAGTKPAAVIPITGPIATCTCNDATGCTASVAEPTPTAGYGRFLTVISIGTGNCEFDDADGVLEVGTSVVLEPTSVIQLVYHNAAWHKVSFTDNVP